MEIRTDIQLKGADGRPFLLDVYFVPDERPKPVVVFAHGFKGFKDWGHWGQIARRFSEAGCVFLKFNFSHNGTTLAQPTDFADLAAFAQNNYSKELVDLQAVLDWLHSEENGLPANELDLGQTALIGHSRGGPIVLLQAAKDERVARVLTWSAVSSLAYAWESPGMIADWAAKGQYEVVNGRTGQRMPIAYQMYLDYQAKEADFDLEKALAKLSKPLLIVHGTADPAVPPQAARQLKSWKPDAQLQLIEGADHVYGGRHPFEAERLPEHSEALIEHALAFIK